MRGSRGVRQPTDARGPLHRRPGIEVYQPFRIVLRQRTPPVFESLPGEFDAFGMRILKGELEFFATEPIDFAPDGGGDEFAAVPLAPVNFADEAGGEGDCYRFEGRHFAPLV